MITKHGTATCQGCGLEAALINEKAGSMKLILDKHITDAGDECESSNTTQWY